MDNQSIQADLLEYRQIFEGNRAFVQEHLDKDPDYFKKLAQGQTPRYLIISCSDSRVPPNDLTKLKPGDIFNHRNIANVVLAAGMNANSVIQYAVESLKVKHVIVMGHTFCGGIQAAVEGTSYGGMLDLWLSYVKAVYDKHQDELDLITDKVKKYDRLSELNVIEQAQNVWKNPYVQKSWKKGHQVWVHGWIFRVESGKLEEIVVHQTMPVQLKVHQFKFEDSRRQSFHGSNSSQQQQQEVVQPVLQEQKSLPSPPVAQTKSIWEMDDFDQVYEELKKMVITDDQMKLISQFEPKQDDKKSR